ncbi:hypothetical protein [Caulobacter sp.]|uniref:hypothetical protein n=1 Tax=Caulobacter sp. TaxID=78 RepID=UPI003BAA1D00
MIERATGHPGQTLGSASFIERIGLISDLGKFRLRAVINAPTTWAREREAWRLGGLKSGELINRLAGQWVLVLQTGSFDGGYKGRACTMIEHNRRRALADLVGLDAWKGALDKQGRFNLHVDVAFGVSRVGGGVEERARFRICLKRAEVVVIVPPTEPATVDKATVERDSGGLSVKTQESYVTRTQAAASARANVTVGAKGGVDAGISAAVNSGADVSATSSATLSRNGTALVSGQSQTFDGNYRWVITPAIDGAMLDGHPWDAKQKPRMKVRDDRSDRARHLEPTIRIQVRCLREDLEITDIVLKDTKRWQSLVRSPTHRNRVAAAEAVIRDRLSKAGLFHDPLDEPFSELCLAEVSVGEGA